MTTDGVISLQDYLTELKNNASLPMVHFNVSIAGEDVGTIDFVLFPDVAPRAAENFRCTATTKLPWALLLQNQCSPAYFGAWMRLHQAADGLMLRRDAILTWFPAPAAAAGACPLARRAASPRASWALA